MREQRILREVSGVQGSRRHTAIVVLVFILTVATPWIAGIVYFWRRRPRDGYLPPSLADMGRQRLWTTS